MLLAPASFAEDRSGLGEFEVVIHIVADAREADAAGRGVAREGERGVGELQFGVGQRIGVGVRGDFSGVAYSAGSSPSPSTVLR